MIWSAHPQLVSPSAGSGLMVQKKRTPGVVSRPLQVTEVTPVWSGGRRWICEAEEDQLLRGLSSGVIRRASTGMGAAAQGSTGASRTSGAVAVRFLALFLRSTVVGLGFGELGGC